MKGWRPVGVRDEGAMPRLVEAEALERSPLGKGGLRPLTNRCARPARPALTTHSPRRRAAQPDPERLAGAGMPTLPTSGWAAAFDFIGLGKSLPRCRCCHLSCCWPQHSIYLNPIHNCRCILASSQVCQGICPRAERPEFDPRACGGRQVPLAANRQLAAIDNSLRGIRLI